MLVRLLRLVMPPLFLLLLLLCASLSVPLCRAQSIGPAYASAYNVSTLATPSGVGGGNNYALLFSSSDPGTLLVSSNGSPLYAVPVTRDASGHIVALGTGELFAHTPGSASGVTYAPSNGSSLPTLFYGGYFGSTIGQILPGLVDPSVETDVSQSLAGLAFVPSGFPGAGRLKGANFGSAWFDIPVAEVNGTGLFTVGAPVVVNSILSGTNQIGFVPLGSPLFSSPSILATEYGNGVIATYTADAEGNPVDGTRQVLVEGIAEPEGIAVDPVTGDVLFSSYNGAPFTIVTGFAVPPAASSSSSTSAVTINLSTGLTVTGELASSDQTFDPNWHVYPQAGGPEQEAELLFSADPNWFSAGAQTYVANGPSSNWITRDSQLVSNGYAPYSFNRTFTLGPDVDLESVSIEQGNWSVADGGSIILNGITIATSSDGDQGPPLPWISLMNFTAPTGAGLFVKGINVLQLVITDSTDGYEAARLEGILTYGPPLTAVAPSPSSSSSSSPPSSSSSLSSSSSSTSASPPLSSSATTVALSFSPSGLAVDAVGFMYAVDSNRGRVVQLDSSGNELLVFTTTSPAMSAPFGCVVDSAFSLYVADSGNSRVVKFAPNATVLYSLTSPTPFSSPRGIAVDSADNVFINDVYASGRILKFSSTGSLLATFVISACPQCVDPYVIAVDNANSVYIIDAINQYVVKYTDAPPNLIATYKQAVPIVTPQGLCLDATIHLYMSDSGNNRVVQLNAEGQQVADPFNASTVFNAPKGIAVDVVGRVYVADSGNNCIRVSVPLPTASALSSSSSSSSKGSSSSSSSSVPGLISSSSSSSSGSASSSSTAGAPLPPSSPPVVSPVMRSCLTVSPFSIGAFARVALTLSDPCLLLGLSLLNLTSTAFVVRFTPSRSAFHAPCSLVLPLVNATAYDALNSTQAASVQLACRTPSFLAVNVYTLQLSLDNGQSFVVSTPAPVSSQLQVVESASLPYSPVTSAVSTEVVQLAALVNTSLTHPLPLGWNTGDVQLIHYSAHNATSGAAPSVFVTATLVVSFFAFLSQSPFVLPPLLSVALLTIFRDVDVLSAGNYSWTVPDLASIAASQSIDVSQVVWYEIQVDSSAVNSTAFLQLLLGSMSNMSALGAGGARRLLASPTLSPLELIDVPTDPADYRAILAAICNPVFLQSLLFIAGATPPPFDVAAFALFVAIETLCTYLESAYIQYALALVLEEKVRDLVEMYGQCLQSDCAPGCVYASFCDPCMDDPCNINCDPVTAMQAGCPPCPPTLGPLVAWPSAGVSYGPCAPPPPTGPPPPPGTICDLTGVDCLPLPCTGAEAPGATCLPICTAGETLGCVTIPPFPVVPNPPGHGSGDLHLLSLYGVAFDFQATGVFWFVRDRSSTSSVGFAMQVLLNPAGTPLLSEAQLTSHASAANTGPTYNRGLAIRAGLGCESFVVTPRSTAQPATGTFFDVVQDGVQLLLAYNAAGSASTSQLTTTCASLYYQDAQTLVMDSFSGYHLVITGILATGTAEGARISTTLLTPPAAAYGGWSGLLSATPSYVDDSGFQWLEYAGGNARVASYLWGQTHAVNVSTSMFFNNVSGSASTVASLQPGVGEVLTRLTTSYPELLLTSNRPGTLSSINASANSVSEVFGVPVPLAVLLATFDASQLPSVPPTWSNATLQAEAVAQCTAAVGDVVTNAVLYEGCLLDVYSLNSTAAATATAMVVQQNLLLMTTPPTVTFELSDEQLLYVQLNPSPHSALLCQGNFSVLAVNTSSASYGCSFVVQQHSESSSSNFQPLDLSTTNYTQDSMGTLTFVFPGLLTNSSLIGLNQSVNGSVVSAGFTVRAALLIVHFTGGASDGSAQTTWQQALISDDITGLAGSSSSSSSTAPSPSSSTASLSPSLASTSPSSAQSSTAALLLPSSSSSVHLAMLSSSSSRMGSGTTSSPSSSSAATPSSSSPSSAAAPSSSLSASPPTSSSSSSSASAASTSPGHAAGVVGDPQFMGLRGQSFQVHGIDGAVYNLIADHGLVVNARFRFRASGRCPDVPKPTNCWSHPGSYLEAVGVATATGDKLHIASGGWNAGFSFVALNGVNMTVGTQPTAADVAAVLSSNYSLRLTVGNFELLLENSDHFLNIVQMRALDWSKLSSHGLLGQTWRRPSKAGRQVAHIEGDIDDYVEQNNELLGSALVYGVDLDIGQ